MTCPGIHSATLVVAREVTLVAIGSGSELTLLTGGLKHTTTPDARVVLQDCQVSYIGGK